MIDPAAIPQIAGDMGELTWHAGALSQVGTAFGDTGARVHGGWQALAGCYIAPEDEQLFAATGPVQGVSASVGEDLRSVGSALSSYAAEVTGIQTRLRTLQAEAVGFAEFALATPDWRDDQGHVDRHNGLLAAVDAQVAAFQDAERRCANAILALYSDRRYVADNGDGVLAPGEYGLTGEALAALAAQGGLPWGSAEALDPGLLGDIGSFFSGVAGGVGDVATDFAGGVGDAASVALAGLGGLIGYADGGFSWETAGTAWSGLNALAFSLTPFGPINQFIDLPFMPRGSAQAAQLETARSLSAFDTWAEIRPGPRHGHLQRPQRGLRTEGRRRRAPRRRRGGRPQRSAGRRAGRGGAGAGGGGPRAAAEHLRHRPEHHGPLPRRGRPTGHLPEADPPPTHVDGPPPPAPSRLRALAATARSPDRRRWTRDPCGTS